MNINNVTLYIYEMEGQFDHIYFSGECDAIKIRTNIPELKNEFVEFVDDTRQGVIDQVIARLKSRGLTGRLRVIGCPEAIS